MFEKTQISRYPQSDWVKPFFQVSSIFKNDTTCTVQKTADELLNGRKAQCI